MNVARGRPVRVVLPGLWYVGLRGLTLVAAVLPAGELLEALGYYYQAEFTSSMQMAACLFWLIDTSRIIWRLSRRRVETAIRFHHALVRDMIVVGVIALAIFAHLMLWHGVYSGIDSRAALIVILIGLLLAVGPGVVLLYLRRWRRVEFPKPASTDRVRLRPADLLPRLAAALPYATAVAGLTAVVAVLWTVVSSWPTPTHPMGSMSEQVRANPSGTTSEVGEPAPPPAVPEPKAPTTNEPPPATMKDYFAANLGIFYQLVPYGKAYGARITRSPVTDSPAAQLGLEPGDLITALDGQTIYGPAEVLNHVAYTTIDFVNVRTGQLQKGTLYILPGSGPTQPPKPTGSDPAPTAPGPDGTKGSGPSPTAPRPTKS
jgi:hypothetical protein